MRSNIKGGSKASDLVMSTNPVFCGDESPVLVKNPVTVENMKPLYSTTGGGTKKKSKKNKTKRKKSKNKKSKCQNKKSGCTKKVNKKKGGYLKKRKGSLKGGDCGDAEMHKNKKGGYLKRRKRNLRGSGGYGYSSPVNYTGGGEHSPSRDAYVNNSCGK